MSQFDRCHNGGNAYESYKTLVPKFTNEFQDLTLKVLTELYIRYEMLRPGLLSDREFTNLKNTWRYVAEELGVIYDYPYQMEVFSPSHPLAAEASKVAKRNLGITL